MAAETITTTPPERTTLGRTIRELREAAGLSRERLARRMGISATTIQRWEADQNAPYFEGAVALAHALEVSLEELAAPYAPEGRPTTWQRSHLSLVTGVPGQLELDLASDDVVIDLRDASLHARRRTVATGALRRSRLALVNG
jgi:transcriptional regulator with XRE-family HTH domain